MVQTTKRGGVYIAINGDLTGFRQALTNATKMAREQGVQISNSLSGAFNPSDTAKIAANLNRYVDTAQRAFRATNADMSKHNDLFMKMGREIGISEKSLAGFAQMQQKAYQVQAVAQYERAISNVRESTGRSTMEMVRFRASLGDTAGAFSAMKEGANSAVGSVVNFKNALVAGAAGTALWATAKTSLQFDVLERSFKAITGSAEGARETMAWLESQSLRLGQSIMPLAEAYRGFAAATKAANVSTEQSRDIFLAVTEAATVLGLSSEKTKYALLALEQSFSKGVLSMEELRRQMGDQIPGAFALAAKAMGKTTAEFTKMVESGQVFTTDFAPKFAAELKRVFGVTAEILEAPAREMERVSTKWDLMSKHIGEAGLNTAVGNVARGMQNLIDIADKGSGVIGGVLGGLTTRADAVAIALGVTAALSAGRFAVSMAKVAAAAQGATGALGVLGATAGGVFRLMGGWGAVAGVAAAGVYLLSTRESEADRISREYAESIKKVSEEYGRLGKAAEDAAAQTKNLTQIQMGEAFKKLKNDAKAAQDELDNLMKHAVTRATSTAEFSEILPQLGLLKDTSKLTADELLSASNNIYQFAEALKEANPALSSKADMLTKVAIKAEEYGIILKSLTITTHDLAAGIGIAKTALAGFDAHIETWSKGLDTAGDSLAKMLASTPLGLQKKQADSIKEMKRLNDELRDAGRRTAEEWAENNRMIASAQAKGTKGAAAYASRAETIMDRLNAKVQELRAQMSRDSGEIYAAKAMKDIANAEREAGKLRGAEIEKGKQRVEEMRQLYAQLTEQIDYDKLKVSLQFQAEYFRTMGNEAAAATESIRAQGEEWKRWANSLPDAEKMLRLNQINEMIERMQRNASHDWQAGLSRGLEAYATSAQNAAEGAANAVNSIANALEGSLVDLFRKGKIEISSLCDSIANDLIKLSTRVLVTGPLAGALQSVVGGWFSGGGATAGGVSGIANDLFSFKPFAQGGVPDTSGLSAFRNSIVNVPTVFPFAKGIGLMGEAGAEAIMPLTRMANGDLGVSMVNDNASRNIAQAPDVNIYISTPPGTTATTTQSVDSGGNPRIDIRIAEMVAGNVMQGGVVAQALETRYPLSRRVGGR